MCDSERGWRGVCDSERGVGEAAAPHATAISSVLADDDVHVRRAAVRLLVGLKVEGKRHKDAILQALADEDSCALERRQSALLQWLPMLSWNLDSSTTSMHVLAQSARRVRKMQWS